MLGFVQTFFAPKPSPIGVDFGTDAIRMAQVLFDAEPTATLREDVPVPPLGNAAAVANAPQAGAGYFKVPKVIER